MKHLQAEESAYLFLQMHQTSNKNAVWVNHIYKRKSFTRDRLPCCTTVFPTDDFLEFAERDFMSANIQKGAYNGTNHITQKAVCRYFKAPEIVVNLHPVSASDMANICFHVCAEFAETRKIINRQQHGRCLVHEFEIRDEMQLHSVMSKKWILLCVDMIVIRS